MNNQVIYNNDIPLISKILKKIYTNLNESRECMIMTDSFNFLYLVLLSPENYLSEPPEIKDYEVPLPLQDLKKLTAKSEMLDPVFMYLIAEIDGEKYVKKIAEDLHISLDNIKRYIQNLVYYNLVTMVDIFQFNNIYTVTNNIHSFNSDLKLQDEGVEFVVKDEYSDRFGREDLLKLYLKLSKKVTIKDFVLQYSDTVIKINITKFVQFGLMKKLIRRMHEYPIKLKPTDYPLMTKRNFFSQMDDAESVNSADEERIAEMNKMFNKFLDGNHCLDEICVYFKKSRFEIEEKLKSTSIFIIQK